MEFTREDVRKIAVLARLDLTDAQMDHYAGQLGRILAHVDKLGELNTEGVEPTSHSLRLVNVLREDEPRPSLPNEAALANAPEQELGCFKVPPIIQEM
ncbi:Asp-tRNA(Asn)/Glu-tRNA(Gln) amidotransferase subunit GatC [bacterium]|nr:Asp-tRNA(Asn)/Glu-tRNA(Gln) amidotransferase subunit GatC [bacterium]